MSGAKIQFSLAEAELMNNANIILTKIDVQEKVRLLLTEVQTSIREFEVRDPICDTPPKISKGENYLGLPYMVLDYPRFFSGTEMALIRSMFWWGQHFSSTLLLGTGVKLRFLDRIKNAYPALSEANYYIGINPDPWQHHFEGDNLRPIAEMNFEEYKQQCDKLDHIKLAARWPLQHPESGAEKLVKSWLFFVKILHLVTTEPVK